MQALPDTLCFLNGEYLALRDARVPVLDRGFLFGDAVYEALPVYGRRIFRFDEHLARLNRGLAKARIPNPLSRDDWLACCRKLVAAQPADDQVLHVQVTRGIGARELSPGRDMQPTVLVMTGALKAPTAEQRRHGVACVTAQDSRWTRGDIKSTSMMANVLARLLAADDGAAETLLLRDGCLTEGASGSVWLVMEGAVLGSSKGDEAEGVRTALMRELCDDVGLPFNLRPLPESDLRSADEVLLTSASKEVLPVTQIDGEPVGHGTMRGKPGPVYARLYDAYQAAKRLTSI
jgi:D-alanine transaminase